MKILIIRLSSLGDIVQCLEAASAIKLSHPEAEIHWLVKKEFAAMTHACPDIDHVWEYHKSSGLLGFINFVRQIKKQNFTHVYDAHSNTRSFVANLVLSLPWRSFKFIKRSKERWRRLAYFKFGFKTIKFPYKGAESFVTPLKQWGVTSDWGSRQLITNQQSPVSKHSLPEGYIVAAPSAAWAMKRWPQEYWHQLFQTSPQRKFVIIGGPDDSFCQTLHQDNPSNTINLAGKINWQETIDVIKSSALLISADTGTLHIADYLNHKVIALIGPTAFGHPSRKNSLVLESNLSCMPCTKDGRGKCIQMQYQKCMYDITPQWVSDAINQQLEA